MRRVLTIVCFALVTVLTSTKAAVTEAQANNKEPSIVFGCWPKLPVYGQNIFSVQVKDPLGRPLEGLKITVTLIMSATRSMPEMRSAATLTPDPNRERAADGIYAGRLLITMAGRWTVAILAERGGHKVIEKTLTIDAKEPNQNRPARAGRGL